MARSLRKLREEGASAFFKQRVGHRNGKVFSPEVREQAQQLLNQGWHRCEAAKELGIKSDTFRKAIYDGRLSEMEDKPVRQNLTTKSTRDKIDADAADNIPFDLSALSKLSFPALVKPLEAIISMVSSFLSIGAIL